MISIDNWLFSGSIYFSIAVEGVIPKSENFSRNIGRGSLAGAAKTGGLPCQCPPSCGVWVNPLVSFTSHCTFFEQASKASLTFVLGFCLRLSMKYRVNTPLELLLDSQDLSSGLLAQITRWPLPISMVLTLKLS